MKIHFLLHELREKSHEQGQICLKIRCWPDQKGQNRLVAWLEIRKRIQMINCKRKCRFNFQK